MAAAPARVALDIEGPLALVRLTRGESHNGMDPQMILELLAVLRRLRRNKRIRAVILHGEGPSFCAGIDTKAMFSAGFWRAAKAFLPLFKPLANRYQNVTLGWRRLSVPVIAAVHGNCFGAGIQLALGADIRIATPEARLSVMESKWGLIPDMGGSVSLRELVRKDVAMELTFTGRIVSGTEALQLGLVTRLADDPLAAARTLAAEIATRSPDAIAAGKQLFHSAWNASEYGALAAERRWQQRMILGRNQRIATQRNLKKKDLPYAERSW